MTSSEAAPARPLWERIEKIRIQRGLTWVQVSRMSGVNRQTITNWKTQPRPPQPQTVAEVADALEIDREEALQLAGIGLAVRHEAPATALDAQDELMERLARIRADPQRRELLDRYLDLLDPSI